VKIREGAPADRDAIRALVLGALAEFGFPVESAGVDADLEEVPEHYHRAGGIFRVLVDDQGTIVGCAGLYPISPTDAELRKMYFIPAVRGRGQGRALLEDLVAEARRLGYTRIVLETASRLTAAIALYQRFGFQESVGPKHSSRCDRTFVLDL
jgi:putative acetyltransferase